MFEEILCETPSVKVTPARVIINGTTYAVANITSIAAVRSKGMVVAVASAINLAIMKRSALRG